MEEEIIIHENEQPQAINKPIEKVQKNQKEDAFPRWALEKMSQMGSWMRLFNIFLWIIATGGFLGGVRMLANDALLLMVPFCFVGSILFFVAVILLHKTASVYQQLTRRNDDYTIQEALSMSIRFWMVLGIATIIYLCEIVVGLIYIIFS